MTIATHDTIERPPATSPVELIMNLSLGYLVSRSLHVAAELGIADFLRDGPKTIEVLATQLGAHQPSLRRLLRTLAAYGVFAEDEHGEFTLTPAAALLQQGVMRDGVLLCGEVAGDGSWWNAVGALRHSVMTGQPAFEYQQGKRFFDYVQDHPECGRWFDRGMANFATAENSAMAQAYDFSRFGPLVDVGGGQGGLLAEILTSHPTVQGTLFDVPQVVQIPAYLDHARLSGRWRTVGGDFFQSVPVGGDAYLLKRILHDWSDAHCVRLLRNCAKVMRATTPLLIMEAVVPPGNQPHPAKVMDMLMMVFGEGRERSEQEFNALFQQAGLRLRTIISTRSTLSLLEVIRA